MPTRWPTGRCWRMFAMVTLNDSPIALEVRDHGREGTGDTVTGGDRGHGPSLKHGDTETRGLKSFKVRLDAPATSRCRRVAAGDRVTSREPKPHQRRFVACVPGMLLDRTARPMAGPASAATLTGISSVSPCLRV